MKKFFMFLSLLLMTCGLMAQSADQAPVTLAGKSGGKIVFNDIAKAGKLVSVDSTCIIISFTCTQKVGEDLVQHTSNSDLITVDMLKGMRKLESGTKVFFEDIKLKRSTGELQEVAPLSFIIE